MGKGARLFLGLWMALLIVVSYRVPMMREGFMDPEGYRIVFYHVPAAWTMGLALLLAGIFGGLYLATRKPRWDLHAATAVELGFLFGMVATVTGSIFSRNQWGAFWNWDPRQTSILALLLLYLAYLALRASVEEEERRARFSAVYTLVAVVPMLFLFAFMPRMTPSLHPEKAPLITGSQWLVLLGMWLGYLGLYAWLHRLRVTAFACEAQVLSLRWQREE